MKTWKSVISAFLAGVMILSAVVTVGAANVSFTDTSKHWAKSQIEYLVSKDVLNGYKQSDGTYTFKPDGTVTRAEFIKMLDETFGLTSTAPINYSDVKTSDWFHPYFSKAAAQGYLLNYGTSISPNGQLTREEATTLLVRYLGLLDAPKASPSQFTDYSSISSNFRDPVMAAVEAGLINGYKESDGTYTFQPKKTLTRAEALTILYRAAGAIYNTSAYAKDAGSADTNAVITRGGVTISGLTLGGRVIVTEGVSGDVVTLTGCTVSDTLEVRGASNVILNNCTVNGMTLDSIAPEITVSLTGGSKVSSLTLESRANLAISSGCRVSDITVNTGAKNVKVTGDGAVDKVSVYAAGYVSTMMPDEFYIASGLSANFSSTVYTGSSADQASFAAIPYVTEEDGKYYLNVQPEATGRVHYYFTNQKSAPSAAEYNAAYLTANYQDSFSVSAGKIYTEETFASATVSRYDYIVIQLVSNNRAYAPVIIENVPTSGTGFDIDPYYDGDDIVYKTAAAGTVYYYYSTDGDELTAAQFQKGYSKADKAMRGSDKLSANSTGDIVLSDRYLTNYPFVIVVLENNNGQYYKPVVVSAGSNGFTVEPSVTMLGTIEFKTSVSGTLYYYYSDSEQVPTPQQFANNWRLEYGNQSITVTKNKTASITYNTSTAESYPFMVFCIKENGGDYLKPFVLKIDQDTGFDVNPYINGNDEISFRAEHTGTVYWYMSSSSSMPTSDTFMSNYNASGYTRRGFVNVRSTATYSSFTFDSAYISQAPYIYIMLVDSRGVQYQPVMINVEDTTNTGFEIAPYCDLTNNRVYFKTSGEGTLYYYFTRDASGYTESAADFMDSYVLADIKYAVSVHPTLDYISFESIDTYIYPGVVLMYVDEYNRDCYPIYVTITRDTSSGTSANGLTVISATQSSVTLATDETGILEYYFIGTTSSPSASSRVETLYAIKGVATTINNPGSYRFLVVKLQGYEERTIDLVKAADQDYTQPEDGSTKTGYGFYNDKFTINGTSITFTATSEINGTATMTIPTMIGATTTSAVTVGSDFTLSISVPLDLDSYLGQLLGRTIQIQLTDSNSEVYERFEITFGGSVS